jgi:hypothetical protein
MPSSIPPPSSGTGTPATSAAPSGEQLQAQVGQIFQSTQSTTQKLVNGYFSYLGALEFFGLVVSLVIFAAAIYFAIESGWFKVRVDRFRNVILQSNMSKKEAQESWRRIETHFYHGGESDLKVAILEADKLLNNALRDAGMMGIQLGDRLKKANESQIPNLNDLWQAHKLRNQIAHESNFVLKRDLAERALDIYEAALKNLGVLDGA